MSRTVLEFVQLFMASTTAPCGIPAGSTGLEMMRFSLVCRTDHTQLCQFRAVTWRLRAEQTLVACLERSLDEAADTIIDLEDHCEASSDSRGLIEHVSCKVLRVVQMFRELPRHHHSFI